MNRRVFLAALTSGALASSNISYTRAASRVFRVAMMAVNEPFSTVFVRHLGNLGYQQGDNLIFELQGSGANMRSDLYAAMAAAIASRHPDVVVAAGSQAVVE